MVRKCDTCKHHQVWWDEIDGKLYHDGSICRLESKCDDEELDYDAFYIYETKDECKFYEPEDE